MRILFLTIFFIVSCSQDEIVTEQTLTVFEDQKILFDSGLINNDTEITRTLGSGRLVLKKIKLPETDNFHRAKAIITLKSTGDPWDKSGSFFILPEGDINNLNEVTSLELLRFITPFGVGHFNNEENIQKLKPSYIPRWEDDITWEEDISHLLPVLRDEVWVGLYIDTWSNEGWGVDVGFKFDEYYTKTKKPLKTILPLLNTCLLYTSPSPRDLYRSRMPSSA